MSEITRYEGIHGHMRSKKGRLVLFTDHEAAISDLVGLYSDTIRELLEEATEKDKRISYLQNDNADRYTKIKRAEERIGELEGEREAWRLATEEGTKAWKRLTDENATLTADLAACRSALDNCLETLVYVRQYFDGSGLSALDDVNESIKIAQAARKEAK
jgi:chromosome segregation ATPase